MRVRVITDSSTNVPDDYLARLKIIEVPAIVNFGAESYLNKVELSVPEFYRRLAAADRLPTTAQPAPGQCAAAYAEAANDGADAVVAVSVSGKLSGTLNSMTIAAESAPLPVYVWDSLNASMGAGWQAILAAEYAERGLDAGAIMERLHPVRSRMQTATTPATLRYLVASGRAPRLQGAVGDLLNVKPILSIRDGFLEPVGRARGHKRAMSQMVETVAAEFGGRPARLAVAHANVLDEAQQLLDTVRSRMHLVEAVIVEVGPALASLAGPGLIALAGYAVAEGDHA